MAKQYTLVIMATPDQIIRTVLTAWELRSWFSKWTENQNQPQFYIEKHNGIDNDAVLKRLPGRILTNAKAFQRE